MIGRGGPHAVGTTEMSPRRANPPMAAGLVRIAISPAEETASRSALSRPMACSPREAVRPGEISKFSPSPAAEEKTVLPSEPKRALLMAPRRKVIDLYSGNSVLACVEPIHQATALAASRPRVPTTAKMARRREGDHAAAAAEAASAPDETLESDSRSKAISRAD